MTAKPEIKPVLKPLDKMDFLALEICRYRNHISQVHDLDAACRQLASEVRELDVKRHQGRGQMESYMRTITHVTAEARDQVGRLMALGMTQDEISALIPIPAVMASIELGNIVPERLKPAKEESAVTLVPDPAPAVDAVPAADAAV